MNSASSLSLIPMGFRNSSTSISPGCVGGRCVGTRIITRLIFETALTPRVTCSLRRDSCVSWWFVRGSTSALQLTLVLLEQALLALPSSCFQDRTRFRRWPLHQFATHNIQALDGYELRSNRADIFL